MQSILKFDLYIYINDILVDESKTHSEMIQTTLMPILLMIIEL